MMKRASNISHINKCKWFNSSIKRERLSTQRLAKWEPWQYTTEPHINPPSGLEISPLGDHSSGLMRWSGQTLPVSSTHLLLSDRGEKASPGQRGQLSVLWGVMALLQDVPMMGWPPNSQFWCQRWTEHLFWEVRPTSEWIWHVGMAGKAQQGLLANECGQIDVEKTPESQQQQNTKHL